MRDPTDQFDLPDHLAWQMNLAIEHNNLSLEATGILGETVVPTFDDNNYKPIMHGMEAIRWDQEDCKLHPRSTPPVDREPSLARADAYDGLNERRESDDSTRK